MTLNRLGGPIYGEMPEGELKIEDFPELIAAGYKRVPRWYGHSDDHLVINTHRLGESEESRVSQDGRPMCSRALE